MIAKGLKLQRLLGDVFGALKQSSKDSRVSSPLVGSKPSLAISALAFRMLKRLQVLDNGQNNVLFIILWSTAR